MKVIRFPSLAIPEVAANPALELNDSGGSARQIEPTPIRPSQHARIHTAMGQAEQRAEFERLVLEQLDPATGLAMRLTNDWHRAEELVQETMLRAAGSWQSFRQQSSFKTWLYRILINAFRDQLRKKEKIVYTDVPPENCVDVQASVAAYSEANELAEIITRLIGDLPPRQREVLVLVTYESLTSEQVAAALEVSVGNVHANLSTARRKLKQQLSSYLKSD